jgi:thioredoxin 1
LPRIALFERTKQNYGASVLQRAVADHTIIGKEGVFLMATKAVGDNDFATEVLGSSKPVLVDFWAEWCGPCKMIGPSLEEISEELGEKVTIAKLNIDDHPDTPGKYGVRGIPTMILFKDGEIVETKVGAAPKAAIKSWLEAAL